MERFDIKDIGYIYFSVGSDFEEFMNRKEDNFFSKSFFLGGCNFFIKFFYFIFHSPFNFKKKYKNKNGYLIYGESVNNRNTLMPIVEKLDEKKVIPIMAPNSYPNWRTYWYAIPYLFELCREIKKADTKSRSTIKRFFPKFWRMYGYPKLVSGMLEYYKPTVVVMANDHLPLNRCLMREANKRNIQTIYVQHAAITDKFPPLAFSYSLLDGEDSFKKYDSKSGTSGHIYLTGGIRFDRIKDYPKKRTDKLVVGVAINLVDSERIVKETCMSINHWLGSNGYIVLRPHPQMKLDYWNNWCSENNILLSNARDEFSFAFISRISLLVANQSSIHLDAAMCRTPSIVYNLSEENPADNYAFVKNKMVPKAENIDALISLLDNIDSYHYDDNVVKFYNCSYNSKYEQRVSEMMADLLYYISDDNVNAFNEEYGFEIIEKSELCTVYRAR